MDWRDVKSIIFELNQALSSDMCGSNEFSDPLYLGLIRCRAHAFFSSEEF
jgi:hypothetical protein